MLKFKKNITTILMSIMCLSMLCGCSMTDVANDTMVNGVLDHDAKSVNTVIDDDFSGAGDSWDKSFSTSDEQEVYTIEVSNTGLNEIKVFVNKTSENGENQIAPITIAAGETEPMIAMQTDGESTRYVVITPTDGEAFQGNIRVMIGNLN